MYKQRKFDHSITAYYSILINTLITNLLLISILLTKEIIISKLSF